MLEKYLNFIKSVSVNKLGKAGVVLTTSAFITFIILELARISGILSQAYIGLINYLLFPTLFVIGLILIPVAWKQRQRETGKSATELLKSEFPEQDVKEGFGGSAVVKTIILFTIINILFMIIVSSRMLSFMDEAEFCGTACHSVMNPEWTTYQQSPHAHVRCVQCHVGEGTEALLASKLNGAYQVLSLTFHLYKSPIPTPVHQLRPARETCQKCHWPDKFYGTRLKTFVHYDMDKTSTPKYTTLNLKVDIGRGNEKAGIHWHISKNNTIRYASVNDERREMIWVEVHQKDGSVQKFINKKLIGTPQKSAGSKSRRIMDCVDCHNRATHIYENPAQAIDRRMHMGLIDRSIPEIKRQGLAAITANYPSKEDGLAGIKTHIYGFYRRHYPQLAGQILDKLDRAIATLQAIYSRNIHPGMKITWGSYPNFIGHEGCFRCHNENMVNEKGKAIPYDCTTCHSILAFNENEPFKYLKPAKKKERNAALHKYLQNEFLNSYIRD